jgi:hypothetical protein
MLKFVCLPTRHASAGLRLKNHLRFRISPTSGEKSQAEIISVGLSIG